METAIVDVVGIIFAWQTYRWRPRSRFEGRRLRDVSGVSGTMMLTQVLGLLLTRIQDVVIGRYIAVAAVGTYRIAWRMIDICADHDPGDGRRLLRHAVTTSARPCAVPDGLPRMLGLGALITNSAIAGFGRLSSQIIQLLSPGAICMVCG